MKMRLSIHVTIHTKIFLLFKLPPKALILGKPCACVLFLLD